MSEPNQICKNCKQLRSEHDHWIATGEYAENVVCTTGIEMDEQGRYRILSWFTPVTNLEFLELKSKENEDGKS